MEKYKDFVSIPDRIRQLAREIPSQNAIIACDRILTYLDLDRLSDRVAYALLSLVKDKKENTAIGLLLDRKSYVFPLELGVVRAGMIYVPMTDEYPDDRINYIMSNSGCSVLITARSASTARSGLDLSAFEVLYVEDLVAYPGDMQELPAIRPEQITHIIYTSGSTGRPKGIAHTALSDALTCCIYDRKSPVFEYADQKRLTLSVTQISFVVSYFDYMSLYAGGTICFAGEEGFRNLSEIAHMALDNCVQSMFMTPSFLKNLLEVKYGKAAIAILDVLVLGGEKSDAQLFEPVFAINPEIHIINGYGSTETNGGVFFKLITNENRKNDLGVAQSYISAETLCENGNTADKGELVLSGANITSGYIGLKEETGRAFFEKDGKRFFRTGDIVFRDETGSLTIIGRKDDMVKFHGQRVELSEIESVMKEDPRVGSCKVMLRNNGNDDFLAAFFSASEKITAGELSAALKEKLPPYMVPGVFIQLDELPLNFNKKIDRQKLAAMEIEYVGADYEEPETETERLLCDAFGKALGIGKYGAASDFFACGGTSLSVSRLVSDLADLGLAFTYNDIFNNPTPRLLSQAAGGNDGIAGALEMNREEYPLTRTQLGIYLEGVTGGSTETYTTQYMMEADPSVTEQELIDAVHAFFDAHPNIKYQIKCRKNELPYIRLCPEEAIEIPVFEGLSKDRIDFINNYKRVIPILDSLLIHFAVYKSEKCCYLIIKSHLVFMDATTISLIISDLNRALGGKELLKEEYCIQQVGMYEAYLVKKGYHEKAESYLKELFGKMEGIDPLAGDLNGPLTPGVSKNFRYEPGTLSSVTVKEFCDKLQITEGSFFIGAMSILLGKYLNTDRVSFSTVYNGRNLPEANHTLGTLIKRIPVYGDLTEDLAVPVFLRRMSKQLFATMSNDIYSFDEVLKNFPVNEDVEFIYQGDLFTDQMGAAAGQEKLKSDSYFMEQYHTGMVTGCLSIQFFSTDGLYNMTIEYRNERFSQEWVEAFADRLFTVAKGLLVHEKIGDIVMMNEQDKERISGFNNTDYDIGFRPVHMQISEHAKTDPDRIAVIGAGERLSYKALDLLSSQVAEALIRKNVGVNVPVGVLLDRTVWAYVAENGILKAGGAFVPFIPEYPDERIGFCMKDASISCIVTTRKLMAERPGLSHRQYECIALEDIFGVTDLADARPDEAFSGFESTKVSEHDLAYCIYTSGSTGRPKGVMIEHKNIANYVHRNEKSVEIMNYAKDGRVCLAMAAFSFDVSVVEQFIPLCNGNTVCIATEKEIHDPADFARLVHANHVNGITCTPTYLLSLLDIPVSREAIRQMTFFDIGAEAFPAALYSKLRELRDDSVILNVYGPTECTMGCSAAVMEGSETVTVGGPIANTQFHIFDKFGSELPVGVKGELIIAGDQVGRGYINLPEKTRKVFFEYNGKRAYHSGDLCAWTENGEIKVFGRIDNQIKLRGFRIELDEIEKVMTEYSDIKAAAVKVIKLNGKEFLTGYYTSTAEIDGALYKKHMQEKLPEYMVPQVLMPLADMPVTVNGKLDRKALPVPDIEEPKTEYIAPTSGLEKKICAAFEKALHLPEQSVGIKDDFFALGGDSLKTMSVLAEADIESLSAADIFQKRTPQAIASFIEQKEDTESLDELEAKARLVPHKLSEMQVKMIDYQLYKPGSSMWSNMHALIRFGEKVSAFKLCEAVNAALKNHPSLGIVFEYNDDLELQQRYDPDVCEEVVVENVTEEKIGELRHTLIEPFKKILSSRLYRIRVFQTEQYSYLFIDVHHLLMDGGSLGVLLEDIVSAYFGKELRKDYYFTLLQAEDDNLINGTCQEDKTYFENLYGTDYKAWSMIPDIDHSSNDSSQAGREIRLNFDCEQVKKAEEYWKVSHSVMAIASALIALGEYNKTDRVMTNWIFNNRLAPRSMHAVGMLIKNLPVAVDLGKFGSVGELLLEVKKQVGGGIAHTAYDYFAANDSAFMTDPMEVNLQLGINGSELDVLSPEFIELDDPYSSASARLELELLENEYGDGGFDAELEYFKGLYDEKNIYSFHDIYVKTLEAIIHMKEDTVI